MSSIVSQVSAYVESLFDQRISKQLTFHNFEHTREVVTTSKLIATYTDLDDRQVEMLQIAAWFHDTGYCLRYYGHEEQSALLANNFLGLMKYPITSSGKIEQLILSTKFPQQPHNLLENIICDADLAHLAKPDYNTYEKRLREEWRVCLEKIILTLNGIT